MVQVLGRYIIIGWGQGGWCYEFTTLQIVGITL